MKWKPIEDLPVDWRLLSDGELGPLLQFWIDQRESLEAEGSLAGFTNRLNREWSIETGQIEGVYDLDRGVTQILIERGIREDFIPHAPGQRPPEIVAAIINDHAAVLDGLFEGVKGDRRLTRGYIHELHAALLHHQETTPAQDQFGRTLEAELVKGRYKQYANNPTRPDGSIYEYCPPEHVDAEMDRLIEMHGSHEAWGVPVEIEGAWLHHRFAQIHPYQDGNGRVARALATLCFIRAGWFPLVVSRDERVRYIDALERADDGSLRPLVDFFVDVQRHSLFQATQTAAAIREADTVDDAIANAKQVLRARAVDPSVWRKSRLTADHLISIAQVELLDVSSKLNEEMSPLFPGFRVLNLRNKEVRLSMNAGYQPNTSDYDQGGGLEFSAPGRWTVMVKGHAIGSRFRGLIGIIVTFGVEDQAAVLASPDVFQVNHFESQDAAEARFRPWLERSLARAIDLWRKSL